MMSAVWKKTKYPAWFLCLALLFASFTACAVPPATDSPAEETRVPSEGDTDPADDPTDLVVPDPTGSTGDSGETSVTDGMPATEGTGDYDGTEPDETREDSTEELPQPEPTESESTAEPLVFVPGYRARITVASARIRAEASMNSDVIGSAVSGDVLDVTGTSGDFYVIDLNGRTAYIHRTVAEYGPFERPVPPETEPTAAGTTPPPYTPGSGRIICLDAGHKPGGGISEMEPNGPGSSVMKAKLTTGTQGNVDGIVYYEYDINQQVTLKLKEELESRGYLVVCVDRSHSNAERAVEANNSGASAFVRIHCNGSTDPSVNGAMTYAAGNGNPYMDPALVAESQRLSAIVEEKLCAATGARKIGVLQSNDMTGINWSQVPVTIVEMGFMTNPDECRKLISEDYQWRMAVGIADGIDAYLGH